MQKKVENLLKGRQLVGYSVMNKVDMLELQLESEDLQKMRDISMIFNKTTNDPQVKFKDLCAKHLNLVYNKKPANPYAVNIIIYII